MTTQRTFDWRPRHDPRSRLYPASAIVGEVERSKRMWAAPFVRLDQGAEGACVGFAWTIELRSAPVHASIDPRRYNEYASRLYREAQTIDEWPGEDYEGTSVLAGAKIAQRRGLIQSYFWAFSIDDVIDILVDRGPVVIGIWWYSGMYQTRHDGLVDVSGSKVGGHALCLTGYDPRKQFFDGPREVVRWRNSWGAEYGHVGDGYIEVGDLAELLADQGEACVPVR